MPWQPGQSGNPRGRVKKPLTTALEKLLVRKLPDGDTRKDRIARKVMEMAEAGDMDAVKFVADRLEGKAITPVEVAGANGGPVLVKVQHVDDWQAADG